MVSLPPWIILDPPLQSWLREDIGHGDRTTQGLNFNHPGNAYWIVKEAGIVAGLPMAGRIFSFLDSQVDFDGLVKDGNWVEPGQVIARMRGPVAALLTGERVALNLVMRLSGISSLTRTYVDKIADFPAKFVDTRKTTPGLRILEKYASQVGGAINHRMGLDDAVMLKDNHIQAAGGIALAVSKVRENIPYPLTIEVETSKLIQIEEAIACGADIIMLDNMELPFIPKAVALIRAKNKQIKIEASGNITLETIHSVAKTGVDFISSSAPVTQSKWMDISMRME